MSHPHSTWKSHSLLIDTGVTIHGDRSNNNRNDDNNKNQSPMKRKRNLFQRRQTKSEMSFQTTGEDTLTAEDTSSGGNNPSVEGGNNDTRIKSCNVTTTLTRDAIPSPSLLHDLQRVLRFMEEERHLVAFELYRDVKRRLDSWRTDSDSSRNVAKNGQGANRESVDGANEYKSIWKRRNKHSTKTVGDAKDDTMSKNGNDICENQEAYDFWMVRRKEFEALEKRATLFHSALQNLHTPTTWTHSQTLFGITTSYRRESNQTLSIKIEGELHNVPLFEQMVILREVDLYHTWAPFCLESKKLAQLDTLDVVAWYKVGTVLVGLWRDACYRAVGCDCMREDGSVLLVAVGLTEEEESGDGEEKVMQSRKETETNDNYSTTTTPQPNDNDTTTPLQNNHATFLSREEILSTIALPPIPTTLGHGRMTIHHFSASIQILTPTSCQTTMVLNIDPNLPYLPQSLIDFCMKRMCAVLLARLQVAAGRVLKDPVRNCHARRMREDVRFYRDWLLPKFRAYCEELGWVMPPVKAFEISEDDSKAEEIFEGWRSEDMLDVSSKNTPQKESRTDVQTALHQYPIEDINANTSHRRVHSETNASTPRTRKRDRVKRFLRGSSTTTPEDNSTNTPSDTSKRTKKRDKLKHFFGEKESKEEKIAAAREMAQARLRPEPFSDSKQSRLKELKHAKIRAEERILRKSRGGESVSGSEWGSVRSDFRTSVRSESVGVIPEVMEEEDFVPRDFILFFVSLGLDIVLLRFKPYTNKVLELPPFLQMTLTDWTNLLPRSLMALLIIALHATTLWATLNAFLIAAFDTMDFGQQHLAKNLDHAKTLYADAVRKYSTLASMGIAVFSLFVGLVSAIFQNVILKMCLSFEEGLSMPSLHLDEFIPDTLSWIVDDALKWMMLAKESVILVMDWINTVAYQIRIPTVYKYSCLIVSWAASKISSCLPSLLHKAAACMFHFLLRTIPNVLISHLSICQNRAVSSVSWRSEAIEISSFITTRLAVFVLALLLMSYLVLPKPEKKLRKLKPVGDHVPIRQVEITNGGRDKEVSRSSHKRDLSMLSSMSIPMEVINE